MNTYKILAFSVDSRRSVSTKIQEVLTENGCSILARLGLPQQTSDTCGNNGLVIMQVCGSDKEITELKTALNQIDGVNANYMSV